MQNAHGLSRDIPEEVKREVRKNSKFGCVICRSGFYVYEHIKPQFSDATEHNPNNICCLCGSCHDAVTRGQISKQLVAASYAKLKSQSWDEVRLPFGALDFHEGVAELIIGGLRYGPAVETILRYEKFDLIKVVRGIDGNPGGISAVFTDESGFPVFELADNVWRGAAANWDIDIVGARIIVRSAPRRIVLQLHLRPPGVIVAELIDMRIQDCHLIASDEAFAVGRYLDDGSIGWASVNITITETSQVGAAIEFASPDTLRSRDAAIGHAGMRMSTAGGDFVISGGVGCMFIPLGISIASNCGGFQFHGSAFGVRPLDGVRRMVKKDIRALHKYIATGEME